MISNAKKILKEKIKDENIIRELEN